MKKIAHPRVLPHALFALSFAFSVSLATSVHAQSIEINPIVISASRTEQPLSEVLSSVSVITRQDIERSQAASLADLIQGEVGFEFGRNGGPGTVTSFFVRGQNSINVVVMIDGVRSQVDGIGALQVTDLPLANIERIEILRGNASALYGDAAVGGVISVFTRRGKGAPAATGSLMQGSRKASDVNVGYGGVVDDLRFQLNAGHARSDGFSAMNPQHNSLVNSDKDPYQRSFVSGNLEKSIDADTRLGVRFQSTRAQTDFDSGSSFGGDQSTDVHVLTSKNQQISIFGRNAITPDWVSSFDVSHATLSYENSKNAVKLSDGLLDGNQVALRWFNTFQARPQSQIQFGIDQSVDRYSASGTYGYSLRRNGLGWFAGWTEKLGDFTLQANGRRDQIRLNRTADGVTQTGDLAINSSLLGLGYALTEHWKLTATVSTGFRAPTAYEISTNTDVKPETYSSKEAGLAYSQNHVLARLVYFQTKTRDAIDYDSNYSAVNIGQTQNQGVEANLRTQWWGNNIKMSWVNQDPRNVTAAEPLARRAKTYGSFDISRSLGGYDLGAKFSTSGQRKDNPYTTTVLDAYALWSLYASRPINTEWTARLRLENAFNKQYQLAYGYNTPGRGLLATLQYQPK